MKKLTIIIAGFLLLISASAFVKSEVTVSTKIKNEFEKNFSMANDVKWEKEQGIYVATFTAKDQQMAAAFNEDGTLISVSRYITLSQLPLSVSIALGKEYAGYTINNTVIELLNEGTSYFITAENKKYTYKIEANTAGIFSVINRTKKK